VVVNAYIPDTINGDVYVYNTNTSSLTATISVGSDPLGVAVTPDGSKALVTNQNSNTVSVIDTANNTVSHTLTVGSVPFGVAANNTTAYVANSGAGTVSPINLTNNTVGTAITVGNNPYGIAMTPDGTKVYVANDADGTVSVIKTATNTVSATLTVGSTPYGIAITPDGKTAYVACSSGGKTWPIDVATDTVGTAIAVSGEGVVITPDGTTVYIITGSSVIPINTATNTAGTAITVGNGATGAAITPDGAHLWVPNETSHTISIINPYTNTVSSTITMSTSDNPGCLGIFIQPPVPSESDMPAPQGRLTLSSTAPVMTADATAQSTIYYLPYQGAITPVYNGSAFVNQLLGSSGISLALDSNAAHTGYQASGSLFDIFAFLNSGTLTLGTGPAWTNSTTRSAAITQVNGIWVNNASITLRFGSASGNTTSVSANQATYLGTMYATANGQTGMQFTPAAAAGGSNNILGLYNAYNRVFTISIEQDSNGISGSWNYNTSSWRAADGSNNNSIRFIDGLQQSAFTGYYQTIAFSGNTGSSYLGIGVDSTTTPSGIAQIDTSGARCSPPAPLASLPLLGLHYVQAMEFAGSLTTYGDGFMQLVLEIDM
jgi:YVTN family beta-propeller protein